MIKEKKLQMQNKDQLYKDKEWLFDQLFIQEKTFQEISNETGFTLDQLYDWAQKKYHLNVKKLKWNVKLSNEQQQIVLGGLLGDGHISPNGRYTESHCESEKEYLLWKVQKLSSLFRKNYTVHLKQAGTKMTIDGVNCNSQNQYGCATCINKQLQDMRLLSRMEIIDRLSELGFVIFCLDDGSNHYYHGVRKSHSQWTLGTCSFSEEEAQHLVDHVSKNFHIQGLWEYSKDHEKKDIRVRFNAEASERINNLILKYFPQSIDIVDRKVRRIYG